MVIQNHALPDSDQNGNSCYRSLIQTFYTLFSLFFVDIFLNKKVVIVIAAGEKGGHHKKVILSSKLKNYAPVFLLFFGNIFLFSSYFFWWKNPFFLFFWPTYVLGTLETITCCNAELSLSNLRYIATWTLDGKISGNIWKVIILGSIICTWKMWEFNLESILLIIQNEITPLFLLMFDIKHSINTFLNKHFPHSTQKPARRCRYRVAAQSTTISLYVGMLDVMIIHNSGIRFKDFNAGSSVTSGPHHTASWAHVSSCSPHSIQITLRWHVSVTALTNGHFTHTLSFNQYQSIINTDVPRIPRYSIHTKLTQFSWQYYTKQFSKVGKSVAGILKLRKHFRMWQTSFEHGINLLPLDCFRGYRNLSTLSITTCLAFGRTWYCTILAYEWGPPAKQSTPEIRAGVLAYERGPPAMQSTPEIRAGVLAYERGPPAMQSTPELRAGVLAYERGLPAMQSTPELRAGVLAYERGPPAMQSTPELRAGVLAYERGPPAMQSTPELRAGVLAYERGPPAMQSTPEIRAGVLAYERGLPAM